jgi:DNA polymerase I-like protein with 3'-5' exonuclease and polymerase domains
MAKRTMIRISENEELRYLEYEMTMQVHDEVTGECPTVNCPRAMEIIRPIAEQPFIKPLRLAMPVSIGFAPTWETAKT